MIAKRDFENEKRPPTGVVSPVCGRHEDHSPQAICSQLVRQMTRTVKMIADGNGENAVPLGKWFDCQWDAFLLLPPAMRAAYFSRGRYSCHVDGAGELEFQTWAWTEERGEWITLSASNRHIDIRAADVVSAAVIY